jgi:hypothetical protein
MSNCALLSGDLKSIECSTIPNRVSEMQLTMCQYQMWKDVGYVYVKSIDKFIRMAA